MDVLSHGTINIFHINHSIKKGETKAYYSSMATRSVCVMVALFSNSLSLKAFFPLCKAGFEHNGHYRVSFK